MVSFRLPMQEVGGSIPDPPVLKMKEVCYVYGLCLCNPLRLTQPNDRETVIEG